MKRTPRYNWIAFCSFVVITTFIYFNRRPRKPSEATGTTGALNDQGHVS